MNSLLDEARAALFSVWHRKWIALGIAWGVCLLGWLAVAAVPNSYESKSRIFVQLDDPLAEQIGIGASDRRRDIERVRQTLTSAVNLEKVVRSTRLGDGITTPKQMETMVTDLGKAIKVKSEQDNLFEISATSTDSNLSDAESAKLAQEIVQKMIDIFREENLAGGRGEMTETLEFMNQQLADRQKQLEAAEQRRSAFEAQHPELSQGGASLIQRLEGARTELRGLDADIAAAQSALAAINGQLAGTPQSLTGPGAGGGARSALAEALGQLAALRSRGLTDNHPDVIAARNQVAQLRTLAANEGPGGGMPNPAYSSLQSIRAEKQANLQALITRRAAALADQARLTGQQVANPEASAEAQRISRDYDVLKQQYDKLLQDREQLRLRGQVENERSAVKFQVIDPPSTPRKPVAPNRPLLLMGVLVVGLGAGMAGAFAVGQLTSGFHTMGRLEKAIGLPVLGAISHTMNDVGRAVAAKRLKYFMAASAALGVVFVLLLASEFIQRGMVA
ncbi:chain-length determining protein [Novosphingobium flavum]|uniref:Chain-length determining protein n=1 Tax=Novosphingobium aerophilum TaxID=2839843 RepID=A0A7X1F5R7_9SPHN|nr:XrtA system polysaccharide chain length determinant [Novosphingobium aerophilum]MBC2650865.1 chain-length determining protein [Novosphingobium aerophilum]MBC2661394.1 chain-length determining protein [Novosphingobium aerophilum]